MLEILESRAANEIVKRDEAIENLQNELYCLEDEKKQFSADAEDLRIARLTVEDLKKQVGALEKDVSGSKAAEEVALARLEKVVASNESLRNEIAAERSSSQALSAQVELLQKRLEEARVAGLAAVELYQAALGGFGGTTSPLPADASALSIFGWFKENVAKLPEFVGGAVDFGALSCATNLCKTLGKLGCSHFASLRT